jgi:hypothetical protein
VSIFLTILLHLNYEGKKKEAVLGCRFVMKEMVWNINFTKTPFSFRFISYEMHINARNIPFYFRKKSGFPKMVDWGVANLMSTGRGITALVKVDLALDDPETTLIPRKVVVKTDDIKMDIVASKNE